MINLWQKGKKDMAPINNDRKINALLLQMQQQTGLDEYKEKTEAKRKKDEELSLIVKDLSQLEKQDPMRVAPQVNENNRQEREREDLKHKERKRVMERVYNRQRARGQRTYG